MELKLVYEDMLMKVLMNETLFLTEILLNMKKECLEITRTPYSSNHILAWIYKKINRNMEVFYGNVFNYSKSSQSEK